MNFDLITKHLTPSFVVDVGARLGDWSKEANQHWPNAAFWLIEANIECFEQLKESPFNFEICALSDKEKEVDFYTLKNCPTATGASYYRENTPFFSDDNVAVRKCRTTTIDNELHPDQAETVLLKLDTQGSELDILKGGERFLKNCAAIVIEISHVEYNQGAPLASEIAKFMAEHDFYAAEKLGDIIHPIDRDKIIQSDMLYLRL